MGPERAPGQDGAPPMHSPIAWALLGLVIERPSYAFELAHRFERTYDGSLPLSGISHIYKALRPLRARGLIEELDELRPTVRSRRRYRATPQGISEHAQWLIGQVAEDRRRQRVLIVQLGALAHSPERALAALDAYEQACIQEIADAPPPGADAGPGTTRLVARLVAEETRQTIASRLRWVQYARAQLGSM